MLKIRGSAVQELQRSPELVPDPNRGNEMALYQNQLVLHSNPRNELHLNPNPESQFVFDPNPGTVLFPLFLKSDKQTLFFFRVKNV